MCGLYIHIPFCASKCPYCDFYSLASLTQADRLVDALIVEMQNRVGEMPDNTLNTVYFGGGTPSLLSESQLNRLFNCIHKTFSLSAHAEITMEVNPEDVSPDFAAMLARTPVNRISLGVQTIFDDILLFLRRRHSAGQSLKALQLLADSGFENISADLMYNLPGLTMERWSETLQTVLRWPITHLSAYTLTIEPRTRLYKMVQDGKVQPATDEQFVDQYTLLASLARNFGWEQYELSNFSKPGWPSKHNSAYWNDTPYIGIGPSAHSYNGVSRRANVASLQQYLTGQDASAGWFTTEVLSEAERFNEFLLTRMRTIRGLSVDDLKDRFPDHAGKLLQKAQKEYRLGQAEYTSDGYLRLTFDGQLISDYIVARWMV